MTDKKDLDKLIEKYADKEQVEKDFEKLKKERNKPMFCIEELKEKARKREK